MVRHRLGLNAAHVALGIPLALLAVFLVWPLVAVIGAAVARAPSLVPLDVASAIAGTLRLATWGLVGSFAVGLPAAWALYRMQWRGRRTVRALVTVPFVIPTIVVAAAFSALFGPGGFLSSWGWDQSELVIVLALVFYNATIVIRVVGAAWEGVDPRLIIAARTLGAGPVRGWLHVTLPALRGAMVAAGSLAFAYCATAFGVVLVLGGGRVHTLETEIYSRVSQLLDLRAAAILSVIQIAIVVVVLFLSRGAVRTTAEPNVIHPTAARPARGRMALWVVVALTPLAAIQLPAMLALVERSLRVGSSYSLTYYQELFLPAQDSVLVAPVIEALGNSLLLAGAAASVALAAAGCIAFAVSRSPKRTWYDGIFVAALGVSAVTLGLGYLIGLRPTLGSSAWLLVAAQAVIALPLAVRALTPAARNLDPRRLAAAAALGASPAQQARHIWWPHVRGAVAVAAAFAFAVALGEFGAATFLARPDTPTLPTVIARLLGRPGPSSVGMAFAAAVILGGIVAAFSLTAERVRDRSGSRSW